MRKEEKKNRKIIPTLWDHLVTLCDHLGRLDRDQVMAIWVFLGACTCLFLLIAEVIREVLNR